MTFKSFLKAFISFRFSTILGLIIALWLFVKQSETLPLSSFLASIQIYLVAFLIVLGFRLVLWVVIEKAGMFSLKNTLINIFIDYTTCILSVLCGCGCLFLLNTFLSA